MTFAAAVSQEPTKPARTPREISRATGDPPRSAADVAGGRECAGSGGPERTLGAAPGVLSAGLLPSFDFAQDRVGSLRTAKSDRLLTPSLFVRLGLLYYTRDWRVM